MRANRKTWIYRTKRFKGSDIDFTFVVHRSKRSFLEKLIEKLIDWVNEDQ